MPNRSIVALLRHKLGRRELRITYRVLDRLVTQIALNGASSRIAVYKENMEIADRPNWPAQHRWILDRMLEFRRVFAHRVRELDLEPVELEELSEPSATPE